jgi:hypothetical protein
MPLDTMIDLETMSTAPDAAVVAIGAVKFDRKRPWRECVSDRFYTNVSLEDAMRHGGRVGGDTVVWWLGQSEAARKRLTETAPVKVLDALRAFSAWLGKDNEAVWGNGSDFDNVVLHRTYYRTRGAADCPWTHRANRCYRTFRAERGRGVEMPTDLGLLAHYAVDDAAWQAMHLVKIMEES